MSSWSTRYVPLVVAPPNSTRAQRRQMRSVVMDELAGRSPALEQMEPYLFDAPDERRREVVAMIRALRALTRDLGLRVHPMRVPDPDRVRFYRPIPSDLVVDEGREPFLAFAKRSDTQAFSVGLAFDAFVRDGDASMPARPSAVGHELAHMISAHGIVLPRSAGGNLGIRSGFKMPGTGSTVRSTRRSPSLSISPLHVATGRASQILTRRSGEAPRSTIHGTW